MSIEFDCEGCGVHVFGFGRDTVPANQLCCMCDWLCEFVPDPAEMMLVRARHHLILEGKANAQPKQ